MSSLDENKLKDEIGITSKAFSEVIGEFANDGEPIYLYPDQSYPIFKEKEYLIANDEKWIVAKNYGELFLEAYRLGSKRVKDIRPVKIGSEMYVLDSNGGHRYETKWDVKNGGVITSLHSSIQKKRIMCPICRSVLVVKNPQNETVKQITCPSCKAKLQVKYWINV